MKHISKYSEFDSTNEGLKSIISGVLIGLSSLISNPSKSINPGITSTTLHMNDRLRGDSGSQSELSMYRDELMNDINTSDIPELSEVKDYVSNYDFTGPFNEKEFYKNLQIVESLCVKYNGDYPELLDSISKIKQIDRYVRLNTILIDFKDLYKSKIKTDSSNEKDKILSIIAISLGLLLIFFCWKTRKRA